MAVSKVTSPHFFLQTNDEPTLRTRSPCRRPHRVVAGMFRRLASGGGTAGEGRRGLVEGAAVAAARVALGATRARSIFFASGQANLYNVFLFGGGNNKVNL
jgi:hypothetical protein